MNFNEYYSKLNPELKEYYKIIGKYFPKFLIPFIESKSLMRLKDVSYFCGATNASKKVYNFKYDISRLDHSISCALHVWNHSFNDIETLSALFHDATTPALSHVIDYLNGDYIKQESTELNLEEYLYNYDKELLNYIKKVGLNICDIANFKEYSLVDLDRPKLCADRLDFIFLNNLAWSRNITIDEVKDIYNHLKVCINEDNKEEFGFDNIGVADRVVELNDIINNLTKNKDDYDEMDILSKIVKRLIDIGILNYDDLFILNDNDIFNIIRCSHDNYVKELFYYYQNMDRDNSLVKVKIKERKLDPLINNIRYTKY